MFSYFALNFREHQIAIVGYSVCTRGRREGRQPKAGVEDVFILRPESQRPSYWLCGRPGGGFFIITTMPETCGRCDVRGATFCGHPFRK